MLCQTYSKNYGEIGMKDSSVLSNSRNISQILMTCSEEKLKKTLMNFFFAYSILSMKIFKNQTIEEFKEQTQNCKTQQIFKGLINTFRNMRLKKTSRWLWTISEESCIQLLSVMNVKWPVIPLIGFWPCLYPFLLCLIPLFLSTLFNMNQEQQRDMKFVWKMLILLTTFSRNLMMRSWFIEKSFRKINIIMKHLQENKSQQQKNICWWNLKKEKSQNKYGMQAFLMSWHRLKYQ